MVLVTFGCGPRAGLVHFGCLVRVEFGCGGRGFAVGSRLSRAWAVVLVSVLGGALLGRVAQAVPERSLVMAAKVAPRTAPDVVSASVLAKTPSERVEVEGLRSEFVMVWANPDGTVSEEVSQGQVRSREAAGVDIVVAPYPPRRAQHRPRPSSEKSQGFSRYKGGKHGYGVFG